MFQRLVHKLRPEVATNQLENITAATEANVSNAAVEQLTADKAYLNRSAVARLEAHDDVSLTLSAAAMIQASDDVMVSGGAIGLLNAQGAVRLENSSSLVVVSPQARVQNGTVGVVLGKAELAPGVKVLISTRDLLLAVVAFVALIPLVRAIIQRFFPPPPPPAEDTRPWWKKTLSWLAGKLISVGLPLLLLWLAWRKLRNQALAIVPDSLRQLIKG